MYHFQQQATLDHRVLAAMPGPDNGPVAYMSPQMPSQALSQLAYPTHVDHRLQQQTQPQQQSMPLPHHHYLDPHAMYHLTEKTYGLAVCHASSPDQQGTQQSAYTSTALPVSASVPFGQHVMENESAAGLQHLPGYPAYHGVDDASVSMHLAKRPLEHGEQKRRL